MFGWFERAGLSEDEFRNLVFMAAVCRCFPGKNKKGGDRVPSKIEVENCSSWLEREVDLLRPELILPVGKLAIAQLMRVDKLKDVVGRTHQLDVFGHSADVIPLPHPSGASTWHRTEPGKTLLDKALRVIARHPAWRSLTSSARTSRASGPSRRSSREARAPIS
jgi:uracil-DNA glycosylase